MNNKTNIFKISNNYILKSLFTYLYYKDILKLANYNKKLQNALGINLENYKNKSGFPKYQYRMETKTGKYPKENGYSGNILYIYFFIFITCITLILFIYSFIYTILLVSLDSFDESNTIENYDKSAAKIIKIINACLFILDAVFLGSYFFFICYVIKNEEYDYGIKKYFKWTSVILIDSIHLTFEGLIIWKLVLSYKIKKDDNPWFMIMDYIFIFVHFLYILYLLFFSFIYFSGSGNSIYTSRKNYLTMFNDFRIFKYELPDDFHKWNKKQRKKYVLDNYTNFIYQSYYLYDIDHLKKSVNSFRIKNGLYKLDIYETNKIPFYSVNESSEMILYPEKNIFKLSNNDYLLRYHFDGFIKDFDNKNTELLNILLKADLKQIQVGVQNGFEYFYISEKYDNTINHKNNSDDDGNYIDDFSIKLITNHRDDLEDKDDDKDNIIKSIYKIFDE